MTKNVSYIAIINPILTYNFDLRIKYLVIVIETFNDGLVNVAINYIKLKDK